MAARQHKRTKSLSQPELALFIAASTSQPMGLILSAFEIAPRQTRSDFKSGEIRPWRSEVGPIHDYAQSLSFGNNGVSKAQRASRSPAIILVAYQCSGLYGYSMPFNGRFHLL